MNTVLTYYSLNMKILLKDKITFIWSLLLPTIALFVNQTAITTELDMRYYWAFIVIYAYMFGLGLHALTLKESGALKTYFSIKDARYEFFYANVITQITFNLVCMTIFNITAMIYFDFNFVYMMMCSLLFIFVGLPFCFLSFSLTLFNNLQIRTLNTIVNIVMFSLLISVSFSNIFNLFNPIMLLADTIIINNLLIYSLFSLLFILIGLFSIKRYRVYPERKR